MATKKAERRKKILLALVTAFLMISSILAVVTYNQEQQATALEYNGFNFIQQQTKDGLFWSIKINKKQFLFQWHPSQLEEIPFTSTKPLLTESQKIAISSPNPKSLGETQANDLAYGIYMLDNHLKAIGKEVVHGLSDATGFDIPKITCEDASPQMPVIVFMYANQTAVSVEQNCILLIGRSSTELLMISERMQYELLGVMQ
ncbi:MAG: hypothetical protein QW594_01955 [Candidatus Woesearchaeota archaeon]